MQLRIAPLPAFFLALFAVQVLAYALSGSRRSIVFWVMALGATLAILSASAFTLAFGLGLMAACLWRNPGVLPGGILPVMASAIIRYGIAQPNVSPWWGVALIAIGAVLAFLAALRAMLEPRMPAMLGWATAGGGGLLAVALGLAWRAAAMGNTALAALALQSALLFTLAYGLFMPLLWLGAKAVTDATGSVSLNWLGGLMRGMPRLGLLMLAGAAGMGLVPLGPGFAPEFLLLHAAVAAATGGILSCIGFAILLAVLGLTAALSLAAAVKLIGLGFLGRPRSLQAAAAEDISGPRLAAMALLAVLCVPVALVPGLILSALLPGTASLSAYAPLPLAILLAVSAGAVFLAMRRFAVRGMREIPAWNGGFARPPVWLPFGDPATQPSATGFAGPVRRMLGLPVQIPSLTLRLALPGRIRAAFARHGLALLFAAFVLCLLAFGLAKT